MLGETENLDINKIDLLYRITSLFCFYQIGVCNLCLTIANDLFRFQGQFKQIVPQ